MKRVLITLCALLGAHLLNAQCSEFYPMKENVQFEYDHFDKKEKLTVRTKNMFKNITGSGNNMKATMVQEIIDKKDKSIGTSESEWICENGTLHFTINSMSMMDNGQQSNPGVTVDVTGDKMDIPSDMKVGQTLKDLNYNIRMSMSGMNLMNRDFAVRDRKVEAQESVTTPAGTFDCLKLTFTTTSTKGIGSGTIKSVMWYAKDTGLVKTETYTEDGKFTGRQVLTKITK